MAQKVEEKANEMLQEGYELITMSKRLRTKLKEIGFADKIETRRGQGYLLK